MSERHNNRPYSYFENTHIKHQTQSDAKMFLFNRQNKNGSH